MKMEKISQTNNNADLDEAEKQLDENLVEIIKGINFLMSLAKKHGLGRVHNILLGARNDTISWAVNMQYGEGLKEQPAADTLFDSGLLYALGIVARYASIKDPQLRDEVYRSLTLLSKEGLKVSSVEEFQTHL